jgi:hypothetical protein
LVDREKLWSDLKESINSIGGGRIMEGPKNVGIESLTFSEIKEDNPLEDFWLKVKQDFDLRVEAYKERVGKHRQNRINLLKEADMLRKISSQIAECLGPQRVE